jgi:hypothetical protein
MHKFSFLPDNLDPQDAPNVRAFVGVEHRFSLHETSDKIGLLLGGIVLRPTDRFDECPAFISEAPSLEVALIGPPPTEEEFREVRTDCFQLQVSAPARSRVPMHPIDISKHLAMQLSAALDINCWSMEMRQEPGGAVQSGSC